MHYGRAYVVCWACYLTLRFGDLFKWTHCIEIHFDTFILKLNSQLLWLLFANTIFKLTCPCPCRLCRFVSLSTELDDISFAIVQPQWSRVCLVAVITCVTYLYMCIMILTDGTRVLLNEKGSCCLPFWNRQERYSGVCSTDSMMHGLMCSGCLTKPLRGMRLLVFYS